MPSPAILSLDELVAPIAGDDPAGDGVPFGVRQQLEELRKEVNPQDFDADDPLRPEQQKKADWAAVQKLAIETLTNTSKDLLVSARLTEALTKRFGFGGLRDGLRLMRRLVEECWDRINPKIEDGDLEVRCGAFNWLDDPDKGARFPGTIRAVPLVELGEQSFGWQHWKLIQDGKSPTGAGDFEKAVQATTAARCQVQAEDIEEAVQELNQLNQALVAKMEEIAPEIFGVKHALEECQTLAKQLLQRKGGATSTPEAPTEEAEAASPVQQGGGPAAPKGRSRNDIYRQLNDLAAVLQQMEPHSPIPYLIQRACELGAMPFPQLMRALIRDENILGEMNRELGIHGQSVAAPAAPAAPAE